MGSPRDSYDSQLLEPPLLWFGLKHLCASCVKVLPLVGKERKPAHLKLHLFVPMSSGWEVLRPSCFVQFQSVTWTDFASYPVARAPHFHISNKAGVGSQ